MTNKQMMMLGGLIGVVLLLRTTGQRRALASTVNQAAGPRLPGLPDLPSLPSLPAVSGAVPNMPAMAGIPSMPWMRGGTLQ